MKVITHGRPSITDHEVDALVAQIQSRMIAEGAKTTAFETAFADSLCLPHAIAVGTGSQALLLALTALDLRPDDAVILSDYTCIEVLAVVCHLGLQPIIVDIQQDYLLSVEATFAAMNDSVKAIVFPYCMGIFRDISPLQELGVPIIEDCANYIDPAPHRVGGIVGDIAMFSFGGPKLLTAGEGGMVVTRSDELAARLRAQKRFRSSKYKLHLYPLCDLQAALALQQLQRLPEFLSRRAKIAELYDFAFSTISGISLPQFHSNSSLYFRYPVKLPSAQAVDKAIQEFALNGIIAGRPVGPLLSTYETTRHATPCATDLYARTLSIPLYPALQDLEVEKIIAVTQHVLGEHDALQ